MDWSLIEGQRFETIGATPASSQGTVLTGGAANTKGSYVQLTASTSFDAHAVLVQFNNAGQTFQDYLVDLAVGAAGSETIIAGNLHMNSGDGAPSADGAGYLLPISIPAGTRLAARVQAPTASGTISIIVILIGEGLITPAGLGRVTTYGANAADSGGVNIDPGGTAHTKGAYSEIVASTTNPIRMLTVAMGGQSNAVRLAALWLVDIAIGAAGSETILLADIPLNCSASVDMVAPPMLPPFGVNIPAGTRLAARAQCSIIDATDRTFDVILYGVD